MSIDAELAALYHAHGALNPHLVVEWARSHKTSTLHARFEWDDGVAAEKYREWQARKIITEVEVVYPDRKVRQVYVSPVQRRRGDDGGYRALVDVLSNDEERELFLQQALDEYERVGAKYTDLRELCGVRDAVAAARQRGRK
jgi:hypothetical protein